MRQVSVSFGASWQVVEILRADGETYRDMRPLVRVNVSVVVGDGDRQESGSHGTGGREGFERFLDDARLAGHRRRCALRQALINLEAVPAPAGRDGRGARARLAGRHAARGGRPRARRRLQPQEDLGVRRPDGPAGRLERASPWSTTAPLRQRRGSLSIDDEGTPTSRTVLIEDGILVGYMQDRQNARLMGMKPTGNGRRQSYAHVPMPRMTNTYMLAGDRDPEEIIASVKNGIYAVNFGGGQVDITSGKYVFQVTEAYKIEDGKLGAAAQGRHADRQRPDRPQPHQHDRQRPASSIPASAPAARTARACRSASASRRCAWTRITVGGTG